jgi:predicted ribosomally synthesized peptide with nif11-like leader
VSQESAKFFLERVAHDGSFARCLERVDSPETLMDMVKYLGYNFTQDELKCAFISLSNLSEEDLARVSGGLSCPVYNGIFWELFDLMTSA